MTEKTNVHMAMQTAGFYCGMSTFERELSSRLLNYHDIDFNASYFQLFGPEKKLSGYPFPIRRIFLPSSFIYRSPDETGISFYALVLKQFYRLLRPFVSYDRLVKSKRSSVYLFCENVVPQLHVHGKVIAVLHDIIPLRLKVRINGYESDERVSLANTKNLLERSDAIITVSEYSKADIISMFGTAPERIHVVYCGITPSKFTGGYDRQALAEKYALPEKYILYFGGCSSHKNVETLVKAYTQLNASLRAGYKLVITNPGSELREYVTSLGMNGRVHYIENIPDSDKQGIYRGASLFVWPSVYEGFGIPPLEAQASGVPVVSSNVTSMPEVIGDAAVFVDPLDPAAMSEAMAGVLTDNALRSELVAKGYENIKRFTWDDAARKLHDIITSL